MTSDRGRETVLPFALAPASSRALARSYSACTSSLARSGREQAAQHLGLVADLVLESFVRTEGPEQAAGDPAHGGKLVFVQAGEAVDGEHGRRRLAQGHICLHVGGIRPQHLGGVVEVAGDVLAHVRRAAVPVDFVVVIVVVHQGARDLAHEPVDPSFVLGQDDKLFLFEAVTDPGRDEHLDEAAPGLVVP